MSVLFPCHAISAYRTSEGSNKTWILTSWCFVMGRSVCFSLSLSLSLWVCVCVQKLKYSFGGGTKTQLFFTSFFTLQVLLWKHWRESPLFSCTHLANAVWTTIISTWLHALFRKNALQLSLVLFSTSSIYMQIIGNWNNMKFQNIPAKVKFRLCVYVRSLRVSDLCACVFWSLRCNVSTLFHVFTSTITIALTVIFTPPLPLALRSRDWGHDSLVNTVCTAVDWQCE